MIRILPLLILLAACGVDGDPVPPGQVEKTSETGMAISGSVEMGIGRTF